MTVSGATVETGFGDGASGRREVLLCARGVEVRHARRGGAVVAVRGVDLEVARGEIVALLGESGSGKTSLGKALLGLAPVAAGSVHFDGVDVHRLRGRDRRAFCRRAQMLFQDAGASFNPRMRVRALVGDALAAQGVARGRHPALVAAKLAEAGVAEELHDRFVHELSGGERQRVALARALVLEPELLVCDEPVSAVDAAGRLTLLDLLAGLARARRCALLLITHDPAAAGRLADRIAVMDGGRIVEEGAARVMLAQPSHACTRALWTAVPRLGMRGGDPAVSAMS